MKDLHRDHYLRLLGFDTPPPPDLRSLRALHLAHLRTVPFENLDIHLGVPIELDADRFVTKILRRRGGFCFELNGAFATLLTSLGYGVTLLEGQVYGDVETVRFGHLCLAVTPEDGGTYLADVGFGRAFDEPLDLLRRDEQRDPAGTFCIEARPDGWLDLRSGAVLAYRFSTEPHAMADFQPGCTFHQTSPTSPFTQGTLCTRRTAGGRVTLAGLLVIETTTDGRRERMIGGDELAGELDANFDIRLDAPALARLREVLEKSV
jgi:N-hydroxyarylamine O-acetyltransferase